MLCGVRSMHWLLGVRNYDRISLLGIRINYLILTYLDLGTFRSCSRLRQLDTSVETNMKYLVVSKLKQIAFSCEEKTETNFLFFIALALSANSWIRKISRESNKANAFE